MQEVIKKILAWKWRWHGRLNIMNLVYVLPIIFRNEMAGHIWLGLEAR